MQENRKSTMIKSLSVLLVFSFVVDTSAGMHEVCAFSGVQAGSNRKLPMTTYLPVLLALSFMRHASANEDGAGKVCICRQGCTELVKSEGTCPEKFHGWPDDMKFNALKEADLLCYALKCEVFCAYKEVIPQRDDCEELSPAETNSCAETVTQTCEDALKGKYTISTSSGVYRFIKDALDEERKGQDPRTDIFKGADLNGDGHLNETEFANVDYAQMSEVISNKENDQADSQLLKELLKDCDVECGAAMTTTLSVTAFAAAFLL